MDPEPQKQVDAQDGEEPVSAFQWKWVGVSVAMYLVFYFLPLMLIPGGILSGADATSWSVYALGIWGTAGIFILSAIPAYYSRGVTVWEPVVSAVVLVLLVATASVLDYNTLVINASSHVTEFVIMLFVVFALSYVGAWWGERHQMLKELAEHPDVDMVIEEADGEEQKQ